MIPLSPINIAIAFLAGFLTFFAGCLAPIVPVYVSFLAGSSSQGLKNPSGRVRAKTFRNSALFVAGFIGVFILLGLTVNSLARSLAQYQTLLTRAGGVILFAFGLHLSGLVRFNIVYQQRKLSTDRLHSGSPVSALALGSIFGFSWTPCIGPVLAAILFWAGSQETFTAALVLMLTFSIGLAIPFLAVGLFFDRLLDKLKFITTHADKLQLFSGVILMLMGILLFTGKFAVLSSLFLQYFGSAAYILEIQQ